MSFFLEFNKETFKFSSSHFTLFSKEKVEALHGHNYRVSCEISIPEIDSEMGFHSDFMSFKKDIQKFCDDLDEMILVPKNSHLIQIHSENNQLQVQLSNKEYSFPKKEVLLLPISNITCEELSRYFFRQLKEAWSNKGGIKSIKVGVSETSGQTVYYEENL